MKRAVATDLDELSRQHNNAIKAARAIDRGDLSNFKKYVTDLDDVLITALLKGMSPEWRDRVYKYTGKFFDDT